MDQNLEKTVDELKSVMKFKGTTEPGDVVLMVKEQEPQNAPLLVTYALIQGFERDPSKKDEWWFVKLLFLTVPPQPVTFILQTTQFTGREIFTMGGKKVFIQAIDPYPKEDPTGAPENDDPEEKTKDRPGLRLVKS